MDGQKIKIVDGMTINPDGSTTMPARRATDLPPDAPWWARWFVANINEAWCWASMRWPAFCAAVAEVYAQYPDQITEYLHRIIPAAYWPHLVALAFVVSMIARIIQKPVKGEPQ